MFMAVLHFPLRLFDKSNSLAHFHAVLFAKWPLLFEVGIFRVENL